MLNILSAALLLCCISSVCTEDTVFTTSRAQQRDEILKNYSQTDVRVRPANEIKINVTLILTSLKKLSWFDGRLTWIPDAGHIEYFLFNVKEIWTPNLVVNNFIEDTGLIGIDVGGSIPLRVSHNGSVIWIPRISAITVCKADITFYPYDTQTCPINITEWSYTSSEVNLEPGTTKYCPDEVYSGSYTEDGEWELMSKRVDKQEVVGGFGLLYKNLQYTFEFKRRPTWYIPILMVPLALMSIMMAGVFLVPVDSREKITYSLTVMLSFTVTLTFMASTLPSVSASFSVIGVYIAVVMVTGGLVVVLTALVLYLHHKETEGASEWKGWAKLVDYICLIFFSTFFIVMMIVFVVCFGTQRLSALGTVLVGILVAALFGIVFIAVYFYRLHKKLYIV